MSMKYLYEWTLYSRRPLYLRDRSSYLFIYEILWYSAAWRSQPHRRARCCNVQKGPCTLWWAVPRPLQVKCNQVSTTNPAKLDGLAIIGASCIHCGGGFEWKFKRLLNLCRRVFLVLFLNLFLTRWETPSAMLLARKTAIGCCFTATTMRPTTLNLCWI